MICAIIQARMESTRLPNKVMRKLSGKPVLWHVVNRAEKSRYIEKIVIATTTNKEDDIVSSFCRKNGLDFFRGSENDVLDRFYQCAKEFKIETVVRITSDCPLHDPKVIDKVIYRYIKGGYDYISNIDPPTYPDGLDVEVFSFAALERTWRNAKLKSEREHVTSYIRKNKSLFKIGNVENEVDLSLHRWTLDQEEDLRFIRAVYDGLKKEFFHMDDVLKLLRERPALRDINSSIMRNEGYAKSLAEDGIARP